MSIIQASATDCEEELEGCEPVSLVDLEGNYQDHPDFPLDASDQDLVGMLRAMILTRHLDDDAIRLQRQGQLGAYSSARGQEAAQVGSAWSLKDDDWIFPTYRERGVEFVRGVDFADKYLLERGVWLSGYDPYEFNLAPASIPIASQMVHAVGLAMGAKFKREPVVAVAYFGDGATSEGDAHEAFNFAGTFQVPCIFFCQNNQYAISVPVSQQTNGPSIAHKAVGYGMPGVRVDGNDVLGTYAVTKWAVERARNGGGPALIEAVTYRMGAHSTADDPTRYRPEGELDYWSKRDPIARMEKFLKRRDLWTDDLAKQVEEEAGRECARVREKIVDVPHGDPMELFEHVYVEPPSHYERQRAQLRAELDADEQQRES